MLLTNEKAGLNSYFAMNSFCPFLGYLFDDYGYFFETNLEWKQATEYSFFRFLYFCYVISKSPLIFLTNRVTLYLLAN